MLPTQNSESSAAYAYSASGLCMAALGALCTIVGFVMSLLFDVSAPLSPAVGAPGMMTGGLIFVGLGLAMWLSARKMR
jgi:hypothetical protein